MLLLCRWIWSTIRSMESLWGGYVETRVLQTSPVYVNPTCNIKYVQIKSIQYVYEELVTSYLASSQAQQGSTIAGCMCADPWVFSHRVLLRAVSSINHTSRSSKTVAFMITQPLPAGGAIHNTCWKMCAIELKTIHWKEKWFRN